MKLNKFSNMALEDILQELTKYGRPSVDQHSVSASGGNSAGIWSVEVWIPSKWDLKAPADVSVTGRRMIGRGKLLEAANDCLIKCQELAESELASWYKFASEEEIREAEANKFT
jgi:hypothetical protein